MKTETEKLGQELAFPVNEMGADHLLSFNPSISKRFYAACAAMQGLLSNPMIAEGAAKNFESDNEVNNLIVAQSYCIADELLKQENL